MEGMMFVRIILIIIFLGSITYMIYYQSSLHTSERDLAIKVYDIFVRGKETGIITHTKGIIHINGNHSDKFHPNNTYYIKIRETEGKEYDLLSWEKI